MSDVFIIRGSTATLAEKFTRPVHFFALTAATASWIADDDYVLIGFQVSTGGGNSWKFGLDNTAEVGATGVVLDMTIAAGPVQPNLALSGLNIKIRKNSTLYCRNSGAGSMAITAYLNR